VKRWLPWLALLVVLTTALIAGASAGSGEPATAAERTSRLAKELRCPTCRGLSVADSDAKAADAIRDEIQVRVTAGQSDDEVRAYLVSRYGEDILLKPRGSGFTGLVWAIPVVALVAAGGGLAFAFRRWSRGP
jgi:cytochrome c-type biogenesis protein CcmH